MDLGKIVLWVVVGFVALWVVSLVFRVVAGLVAFFLPVVVLGVVVYFLARAFGLVKS